MRPRQDRRRTFLVDRRFQLHLAFHYLVIVAFFFLAGLFLVFAPSAYVLFTTNDLKSLEPAAAEFLILHQRIWPAVILTLVGVFGYSLLIGHRIAGPIGRTNETIRRMIRGECPGNVRFRKSDYFHPTAALLTELSGKVAGAGSPGEPPKQ